MDSRNNVIAMMTLGAGIVALGGWIVSGEVFHAEKPEKPGYVVEGVVEDAGEGAPVADVPIATLLASADPAKGAEVFKKCASCHTVTNGGANGIGPNLWGTVGEEIGHGKAGFAFSDALATKGGKWDFDSMNAWLKSPKAFAPGTKMSFAGLSKGEDRANVIAYLNTQGSNLPLPAAAPATAGGEKPEGTKPVESTPPPPGGTSEGTAKPATKPNQ